jgi:hypothetical protein
MTALGHRQEGVRPSAFEFDIWLEACEAAGGFKVAAEDETAVEKEQWIRREMSDLHGFPRTRQYSRVRRRKQVDRFEGMLAQALVSGLNCPQQVLPKMDFAALQ